jgi:riboflavin kinase / FMN hydrolase
MCCAEDYFLQELGIPTANLGEESIGSALGAAVTGIYYGWASVGLAAKAYQMVMSVGFNPFYNNSIKTCEPWLLHDFEEVLFCS